MPFTAQDIFASRYKLLNRSSVSDSIETWKAEDIKTKSSITLRFANEAGNTVLNGLLLKEYLLLTQIRHHRLLMPLHFDEWESISYLVYPFPDGNSLKQNIQAEQFLNEEAATNLFLALLEGVYALHTEGVLHRNIQPSNIFLIKSQYVIGQFKRQNEITFGQQQELLPYSAPELFGEQPEYVAESDLFSVAVVVYYACSGILPWQGLGGLALLKGAVAPKLPNTFSENFSKQLIACMAIIPEERPSVHEIIQAFSNNRPVIVSEQETSILKINSVVEVPLVAENIQPVKEKKRNRKPVFVVIIFLLFTSAVITLLFQKKYTTPSTKVVAEKTQPALEKKKPKERINSALVLNENDTIPEGIISEADNTSSSDTTTSKPQKYTYKKRILTPFRNEAGMYGYMSKEAIIIEPVFEDVFEFSEHLAAVKSKNLWGYIDTVGNWIIKPQFIKAETFKNGMATVQKDGVNYIINTEGTCVTGCSSISQQSF